MFTCVQLLCGSTLRLGPCLFSSYSPSQRYLYSQTPGSKFQTSISRCLLPIWGLHLNDVMSPSDLEWPKTEFLTLLLSQALSSSFDLLAASRAVDCPFLETTFFLVYGTLCAPIFFLLYLLLFCQFSRACSSALLSNHISSNMILFEPTA